MVDYKYFDLFYKDNVNKQAKIKYSGGVITNTELFQNSEELTENLCSEKELRFGSCEASSFKFKVANIVKPMMEETVTFSIAIDHHEDEPILIGKYKVASDKETADHRYREIVAYDAMYDILNADMAAWYNTLLPNQDSAVTMKQFRESFVRHFGLTEVLPKGGLVNDSMTVQRTIQPEQISGKDIITAICEINGCFGHIGRDGKFHYIYLTQAIEGLYPANDLYPDHSPEWMAQAKTGHLYPQDKKSTKIGKGSYIPPCNYESYRTKPITKLQIRKEENDIGKIWPEGEIEEKDNCYIIQNNFLVYGKSSDELEIIAQNILSKITDIIYRPFDCTAVGNPCLEVGDPISISTKYEIVESYILKRTLKGIQALRDSFSANGSEKYFEKVNGVHQSIIQLKGKANILTRTIEETRLEMYDIEEGLNNTIAVTAREIRTELKNAKDGLESTILQTASEIRTEVAQADTALSSRITQNADNITAEVARATGAEGNLSAKISLNAQQILLKVSKDNIIAEINLTSDTARIQAARIDLVGLVNADELVSKFATISTLNATMANLQNLIAQKATITDLNATNLRVQNLEIDKVSVNDFNAANANLQNLIAQKIDASVVKADYMEVANWTSSGYIKADRISANTILSKISNADLVSVRAIGVSGYMNYKGTVVSWRTKTISGTVITYLGPEE